MNSCQDITGLFFQKRNDIFELNITKKILLPK